MKKAIGLVMAGMLSASGMAMAGTSVDAKAQGMLQKAMELRKSLSPAQRAALVDAAGKWGSLGNNDKVMAQVDRDVSRIMTPAQADKFMDLVDPQLSYGGHYLKLMCVANSGIGFLMSTVGVIGCQNETAATAAFESYAAFVFANDCLLTGATSCESAMNSAGSSAAGWLSIFDSCDVADTAYYTMAATYASCGGTWE